MSSWNPMPPALEPAPAPTMTNPGWALRPMTMGEVLDRTFAIYRQNFLLIVGISLLSGVLGLVVDAVKITAFHFELKHHATGIFASDARFARYDIHQPSFWIAFIGGLLVWLSMMVTQAAVVHALSEVYLGRPTTVGQSLRAVAPQWWRLTLIGLWQFISFVWIPLLLIVPAVLLVFLLPGEGVILGGVLIFLGVTAFIPGLILYLRNALAVPAEVIEVPGVRGAMRRSKVLTRGAKWTLFVVMLIYIVMTMVLGGIISVPLILGTTLKWPMVVVQSISSVVSLAIRVTLLPIWLAGTAVIYFNQRSRQEGFDLLFMLGPEAEAVPVAPDENIPVAPAEAIFPTEPEPPTSADTL